MTNDTSNSGLSFAQLFAILRARKLTVLFTLAVMVIGTFVLTQFLPKSYTATAELFIDYRANDPLTGRQFSATMDESYMQTQVDMIKSEEVANSAIDATKMMTLDSVRKQIDKDGEVKVRSLMVEQVGKQIPLGVGPVAKGGEAKYDCQEGE